MKINLSGLKQLSLSQGLTEDQSCQALMARRKLFNAHDKNWIFFLPENPVYQKGVLMSLFYYHIVGQHVSLFVNIIYYQFPDVII